MSSIVAIVGDLHIGGSTALSTPKFEIHTARPDEIQVCDASKTQEWLHTCWLEYWAYVRGLLEYKGNRRKNKLIVICLGDLLDGNHHGSNQIMHEVADQVSMALSILQPIREMADRFYGILGTEAHSGQNHDTEHGLYRSLECDAYGPQLTLDIDGCIIDVAHQRGAASLPNLYRTLASHTGGTRPRYVIGAHLHTVTDTGEADPQSRMVVNSCWQLPTSYGIRFQPGKRSDIGGLIINAGRLDTSRLRYYGEANERKVIKV